MEIGSSSLLKNINEQAILTGEAAKDTLSKLAKALDKGREVGIQETIYRLLGLTMTKFSEVVRFVNTNHPDRRDGLLKQDIENLPPGESVLHNSIHDYYMNRPNGNLNDTINWEKMSLAEFASRFNIVQKISNTGNNETFKLHNNKGRVQ